MKFAGIFLLVGIIGMILLFYVLTAQSLVDWQKLGHSFTLDNNTTQTQVTDYLREAYQRGQLVNYIDSRSLIAFNAGVILVLSGLIVSLGLVIDKLFFCKYYQEPDVGRAILRGILWSLLPVLLIMLAVWHYLTLEIAISTILFFAILETLSQSLYRHLHRHRKPQIDSAPENNIPAAEKKPETEKKIV